MLKVYKGCRNGMVVTLEIDSKGQNNMKRSGVVDPNHAVYRCQSARVVGIEHALTGETAEKAISDFDGQFCYRVGEMVEEPEYNTNIERVCDKGIHFYLTKETAVFHALDLMNYVGYTGEFKCWHANGQRREHGCYKDGKLDGEWETWYGDGQRLKHEWYNDGELNGELETWHDNGDVGNMDVTRMGKGTENGRSGMRMAKVRFMDGTRMGKWEECDENGQCHKSEWKNG